MAEYRRNACGFLSNYKVLWTGMNVAVDVVVIKHRAAPSADACVKLWHLVGKVIVNNLDVLVNLNFLIFKNW